MSNATFEERVKPEEVLEHYGVPGMKWGVHKEETKIKYGELRKGDQSASYERGENYPRGAILTALTATLGVSEDWLLEGEE